MVWRWEPAVVFIERGSSRGSREGGEGELELKAVVGEDVRGKEKGGDERARVGGRVKWGGLNGPRLQE